MAWNGSGTYTQTDGTYSGSGICASQAGDGDAKIKSTEMDALLEDHAAAINACLAKNGENTATGNLKLGTNKITGLGNGTAATDAATYGQTITALSFDSGTNILTATRAAGNLTANFSGLAAGTGGVDLTTAQTVAGIKTFSSIGSHAHAKFNGPTTSKVAAPTPGANVTVDTTAANSHYFTVGTNTDVTFTWPTAASDTQVGANWGVKGDITMRWTGAGYTITLNATMLAALDYYSVEGSPNTASGALSTLTYNYKYIGGTKICQFAWVATP